jgi:DNA (cytosine-5)-methyltransferase 1
MKIVSLFSGCGGLDLGLVKAGHEIVFATDNCKDCEKTYKKNFKHPFWLGDVKELNTDALPDYDLLTGGFPCQGFSIANLYRDTKDQRNSLYLEIVRILEETRPNYFIAENVPGLLSLAGGKVAEMILHDFETIGAKSGFPGYDVKLCLLNAADYGVPQSRKRVIFFGVSKKIPKKKRKKILEEFPPKPTHGDPKIGLEKHKTIADAIKDLPEPDTKEGLCIPNHITSKHKVKINGYIGNRKLNWDKPSPTIVGRGGGTGGPVIAVHPNLKRRLSVRETARIQDFPDDFLFEGSTSSQFRQIGNAVAVGFAYALGKFLKKIETID